MTIYYLRKLIRVNRVHLTVENASTTALGMPPLRKTVYARIREVDHPCVLEKLATVHKMLCSDKDINISQIRDIEFKIFELLGYQRSETVESKKQSYLDNISNPQAHNLLKQIYIFSKSRNDCVDIRATLNYIYPSVLKLWQKNQDEMRETLLGRIKENHPRYRTCWIQSFSGSRVTESSQKPGISLMEKQVPQTFQGREPIKHRDWQDLCQIVRLASQISNNPTPRRSRDLVKMLNTVSVASAGLLGALRTRYYLLESRPQDEWCYMFMISDAGATTYCGSIREIVTATRLKQFEVWMRKFWQMCENKRDEILFQLT